MDESFENTEISGGTSLIRKNETPENSSREVNLQKKGYISGEMNNKKTSQRKNSVSESASSIDFLLDIPLEITIELDRTTLLINELLKLGQGSVLELSKFAGETLDVLANHKLIAKGEVVVVNDKYGIRLTEIVSPIERIVRLK